MRKYVAALITFFTTTEEAWELVFNDPVHGHISVHPVCMAIINTPQFQENITIFPKLHSLTYINDSVCWLAGELLDVLKQQSNICDLITERDELCVKIAALCHDLGHGPFSHLFDGWFLKQVHPNSKWTHEEGSVEMFTHMVRSNDLGPVFAKHGLDDRDMVFILEQIYGPLPERLVPKGLIGKPEVHHTVNQESDMEDSSEKQYRGRPVHQYFLYEIVANKRNGIDVDKWDYFARDCYMLGIPASFDYRRLIRFVRVIDIQGIPALCFRDKEKSTIYDIFHTRNSRPVHWNIYKHECNPLETCVLCSLHRRAYQHKTCNIIEHMIVEALLAANDYIKLPGTNSNDIRISDAIHDMEAYTHLTDDVLVLIEFSKDPALSKAQSLLNRIYTRQLYKFVEQTQPKEGTIFCKEDERACERGIIHFIADGKELNLTPDDVVVHILTLNYGGGNSDPLENIHFWSKHVPNKPLKLRQPEESSPHTCPDDPTKTPSRDDAVVAALTDAFARWCEHNNCLVPLGCTTCGSFTPVPSPMRKINSSKRRADVPTIQSKMTP
eukprot:gene2686-5576_t